MRGRRGSITEKLTTSELVTLGDILHGITEGLADLYPEETSDKVHALRKLNAKIWRMAAEKSKEEN